MKWRFPEETLWDVDSKALHAGSNKTTNPEQNKSVRKSYVFLTLSVPVP